MSKRRTFQRHGLSPVAATAGIPTGTYELILQTLGRQRSAVVTVAILRDQTGLAHSTVLTGLRWLQTNGYVREAERSGKLTYWTATADGLALCELLAEQEQEPAGPAPVAARRLAEPAPVSEPRTAREAMEEAVWEWCWGMTPERLSTASHAQLAKLYDAVTTA
jgi:hypothetical protein